MPILTSQQINVFYENYKTTEITFTKELTRAIGLVPKLIYLKTVGYQLPCIIYAVSMTTAKVIANVPPGMHEQLRAANNLVSLRFAFKEPDKLDPILFFVSARISGFNPYNKDKPNLNFIYLDFTQRPPDDLIATLGLVLEAHSNSQKRREERIVINADSIKKIGLNNKSAQLYIQGVPRNSIIRDLSFSGAKVILAGVAKFLLNKEAFLEIETVEKGTIKIPGTIVRNEQVEGRKDLVALAMQFNEEKVPMEYKMLINDYIKQKKYQSSGDQ
ncbi:MAG TPA: PilZ domain-containing protein [Sediminispirochaeta sp.]|nr:PilZ domain-containing protein [Sediminispirochaeta sp.]